MKLRASLQQSQSLSCARIVIVRQQDQKERLETIKDKANQPPNNKQQKPPVPDQSHKSFFSAHAVHARGSDGHQKVLSLFSYSHVVREQVKSKKPGVSRSRNNTNPNTNTTQNNTTKKTPRKQGETLRFQKRKSSCRSVLLHDDTAIPANRCPK